MKLPDGDMRKRLSAQGEQIKCEYGCYLLSYEVYYFQKGGSIMAMDIRPASALRTEYNELASRSRMTGQPIYITRNGEGDTILMDLNAYIRREEELDRREAVLEHRALVLEAELGCLNGKPTYTADQVREKIRQNLQNRQEQKHG